MNSDAKFHALVLACNRRRKTSDLPRRRTRLGEEKDYEQRDGVGTCWNAPSSSTGRRSTPSWEKAALSCRPSRSCLAADVGFCSLTDLHAQLQRRLGWACADGEVVPPARSNRGRLFRAWGWPGFALLGNQQSGPARSRFKDNKPVHRLVAREKRSSPPCRTVTNAPT